MSFKILICSFFAFSISYIYGTLITASGKLKYFNFIFVVGIILNWSLNLILIPKSGAIGAATATLITQMLVMIAQTILAHHQFNLKINFRLAGLYTILIAVSIPLFYYLSEFFQLQWWIRLGISLILFCFASILIRFIRFKWVFGMTFED